MEKTSTQNSFLSSRRRESEAGMRRRSSNPAMPSKQAVDNILNYARASMLIKTKSSGHIFQVLN